MVKFDEDLGGTFALDAGVVDRLRALGESTAGADALVSAASATVTGAMIALVPREADLDRLVVPGGEAREDLHLTLWFLGEAAAYAPEDVTRLVRELRRDPPPRIEARAFGAALWNPDGDFPCWVLNVGDRLPEPDETTTTTTGSPELATVRDRALDALDSVYRRPVRRARPEVPNQHSPWSPHVCLAYDGSPDLVEKITNRVGPLTLDRIRVAFAGEVTDVPLAPSP